MKGTLFARPSFFGHRNTVGKDSGGTRQVIRTERVEVVVGPLGLELRLNSQHGNNQIRDDAPF